MHPDLVEAFGLHDRVAVVTGAARGIGAEVAIVFAQAGADVVLADVAKDGLDATAERVGTFGVKAMVAPTDVRDRSAVDALAETAIGAFGRIDVWANVAGVLDTGTIADADEALVRRVIDVNLLGTYWGCSAAVRAMTPRGRGSIVNVSSVAGDKGVPTLSAYAMSKAGVVSVTRTLALEAGSAGIRVNAVAPGFVDTPMNYHHALDADGRLDPQKHQELLETRRRDGVLGVTGEPRDIALAMLYLASDASHYVTGQVLRPNGGSIML